VLFSDKDIAAFIDSSFEPAWESVRPVPMIFVDFGNGKKITRTLHGNIATYVCNSNGEIIDVLPGLYDAVTYKDRLNKLRELAEQLKIDRDSRKLIAYHRRAARQDMRLETKSLNLAKLKEDSLINESIRRRQIHKMLSACLPAKPEMIKHWLYKEVLHADLDDPYLGLGFLEYSTAWESFKSPTRSRTRTSSPAPSVD
jgi:hypothetical protein